MNTLIAIFLAIFNSLWVAALLAGLVWLAMRFAHQINAATRFAIWWAVLAVVMILPALPRLISTAWQGLEPEPLAVSLPRFASVPPPTPVMALPPLVTVAPHVARWPLWLA